MANIAIKKNGANSRAFHVAGQSASLTILERLLFGMPEVQIVGITPVGSDTRIDVTIRSLRPAESLKLWHLIFTHIAAAVQWDPGSDEVTVVR